MSQKLGEEIRKAMERRRVKPKQLAPALNRADSYVSQLTTGRVQIPPPDVLIGLHRVLGLRESDMLRWIGYLTTEEEGQPAQPFSAGDVRGEAVDLLRRLGDADARSVRNFAAYLVRLTEGDGGDAEGGDGAVNNGEGADERAAS